jgi:hypothetical protein
MEIKKAVEEATSFEGYFAEDQQSANGLLANILERLFNCVGFIMVMHPRGEVKDDRGNLHVRGSVWIEQEAAMISLIQHFVRKQTELFIAAYIHQSIKREGMRDLLQLNALPFESDDVILPDLRSKLPKWKPAVSAIIQNQRWEQFEGEMSRAFPEHIAALRILTLGGASNDSNVLRQLTAQGLAQNWASVLEGLSNNTSFVQPQTGQPPTHRVRPGQYLYEVKPEAKEFLEDYFTRHPRGKR